MLCLLTLYIVLYLSISFNIKKKKNYIPTYNISRDFYFALTEWGHNISIFMQNLYAQWVYNQNLLIVNNARSKEPVKPSFQFLYPQQCF